MDGETQKSTALMSLYYLNYIIAVKLALNEICSDPESEKNSVEEALYPGARVKKQDNDTEQVFLRQHPISKLQE